MLLSFFYCLDVLDTESHEGHVFSHYLATLVVFMEFEKHLLFHTHIRILSVYGVG